MPKKLTEYSDSELIDMLGKNRLYRLVGSMRGKLQTPHAGPGRPLTPTPCPKCRRIQPSAAAAKIHCHGKSRAKGRAK